MNECHKSTLNAAFAARKKAPRFAPPDRAMKAKLNMTVPPDYHLAQIAAMAKDVSVPSARLKVWQTPASTALAEPGDES